MDWQAELTAEITYALACALRSTSRPDMPTLSTVHNAFADARAEVDQIYADAVRTACTWYGDPPSGNDPGEIYAHLQAMIAADNAAADARKAEVNAALTGRTDQ